MNPIRLENSVELLNRMDDESKLEESYTDEGDVL